jgi:small neutral amino acid transporter SnatA (MarC family)
MSKSDADLRGLNDCISLCGRENFWAYLGLDIKSFAVGGSICDFHFRIRNGIRVGVIQKLRKMAKASTMVPIAFPLIAGSGTLTTIMSLKANYTENNCISCHSTQPGYCIYRI